MTHYETLEVPESADEATIKAAYRKLAKEWHPDVNPDNKKEAEEKFKGISAAYETLSDPAKKQNYDHSRTGRGGVSFGYGPGVDFSNFDTFDVFGRRRGPKKGQDLRGVVQITLAEAAKGCIKTVSVPRASECVDCEGTGARDGKVATCVNCGGMGVVIQETNSAGVLWRNTSPCQPCGGSGKIISDACKTCHGKGEVGRNEFIEVVIPSAITSSSVLRVVGKGNPGEAGPGDLLLIIQVLPNNLFERRGNEIHTTTEVPFHVALAGGAAVVHDLHGDPVTIMVPKRCVFDGQVVLPGKGISGSPMVVKIRYLLPELSAEQLQDVLKIVCK